MFRENLQDLRRQRDITKQEMADLLEIPYVTYNSYENKGSEPPYNRLKQIAKILGVSVDTLLADELPNATSENTILSMRELPPNESICFTPFFVFNSSKEAEIWKKFWLCIENKMLEECHIAALKNAQMMYYNSLVKSLDDCILLGKPQSDFTLRQATADDPKESE